MFSSLKYELVKALHESDNGYIADGFSLYDNNIGECYERFFVAGCLYEKGDIQIPCFGCQIFYRAPEQYYLIKNNNGFRVVDEYGFGFNHVYKTKESAIAESCEVFDTLPIHIRDTTI